MSGAPPPGYRFIERVESPPISFELGDFDNEIQSSGVHTIWEQAGRCPCRNVATPQPDPLCKACDGSGYFYHSPLKIKAVYNRPEINNKWMEQYGDWWSGEGQVTARSEIVMGARDRVTNLQAIMRVDELAEMPDLAEPLCMRWPVASRTVRFLRGHGDECVIEPFTFRVCLIAYRDGDDRIQTLTEGVDFKVRDDGLIDITRRPVPPHTPLSVSYYAHPRWIVVSLLPYPFQETIQTERVPAPEEISLPKTYRIMLDYLDQAGAGQVTDAPDPTL